MLKMKNSSAPRTRMRFKSVWDELDYLNEKIEYWWYEQNKPAKARMFCPRFEKLLQKVKSYEGAIVLEEYRALLYEVKDRLDLAIHHLGRESALIQRLLEIGPEPPFDHEYLVETLIHLGCLYLLQEQDEQAQKTLRQAQAIAKRHGLKFRAANLLTEDKVVSNNSSSK